MGGEGGVDGAIRAVTLEGEGAGVGGGGGVVGEEEVGERGAEGEWRLWVEERPVAEEGVGRLVAVHSKSEVARTWGQLVGVQLRRGGKAVERERVRPGEMPLS